MATAISTEKLKELRVRTGAGIVDCRNALQQAGGDLEQAIEILRAKGLASAEKKAARTAGEGMVEAYIHTGGKLGAMIEVNCETDFVARTDEFRRLARDLAMQVAAAAPRYVTREEIPAAELEEQRRRLAADAAGASAAADGRMEKWFEEVVLLDQPFIKDESRRIQDLLTEAVARIGENIRIRRFARFRVGE